MRWSQSLLICFLGLTSFGFSILPPVWQGVAEIKAIVNDPELNEYLDSGEILESIARVDAGWQITTSRSQILVEVIPQKQNVPGPEKFKLRFSKL